MTEKKSRHFEVCPDCGAHLDYGERCDCGKAATGKEGAAYGDGVHQRGAGM